jgi:hypothetical protein
MTRPADAGAASSRTSRVADTPADEAASIAEDRQLAALHLRVGSLALACAELEDLSRRGALDTGALADLAEARWRCGDLEGAAVAAADHLAAGGTRPVALVIAAEGAVVARRPIEAKADLDVLGDLDARTVDALFAGMPRHAPWPSAPEDASGVRQGPRGTGRATRTRSPSGAGRGDRGGADAGGSQAQAADLSGELDRARIELGSGVAADAAHGVARLALVLRLDPALAPAILDALQQRRDPAALLLRGDACRLLGRHLEAEAALQAASQALGALDPGRPPRPRERLPHARHQVTPPASEERP